MKKLQIQLKNKVSKSADNLQSISYQLKEQGLNLGEGTSDREAECLYSLAKTSKGDIVEIGSFKGKSTIYLAKTLGEGRKIYTIDPHIFGTEEIFRKNLKKAKVDHIVVPLVMKSEEAAKQWHSPIGLLFIDGAHDFENVKKDFELWEPHLFPGGIICFHDKFTEGVCRAIRECVLKSNRFTKVGGVERLLFAEKDTDKTFSDKLSKLKQLFIFEAASLFALLTRPSYLQWLRGMLHKLGTKLSSSKT